MFLEIALLILLLILIWSRRFVGKFDKLPPGPYKWPIIGNVIEVALEDGKYPHIALAKLADKYGDVMSLQFGCHPTIVISSYEAIKEMLVKDEVIDRYFFPSMSDRQFDPHRPLGIIWGAGEMWKKVRRYSIRNMRDFGFGSKRSFEELAAEEIRSSLSYLSQKSQNNGNILSIDLHDFSFISVNILWSLVAGKRFAVDDPNVQDWLTLSDKAVEMLSFDNKYNVFPVLKRLFPNWSGYTKHAVYHQQTQDYMMDMIKSLRAERESREDKSQMTFIERFLDEIDLNQNEGSDKDGVFTEQQLATVLMDIFLGGSETFGNVIAWSILYLSLNPEVQEKLNKAVVEKVPVASQNEFISNEDAAKIPYVRATFLEVLRCSVFLPMPVPRASSKSFKFRDFVIPKDCCIIWNITNVCKDEKFWGDPEAFRPERFIDPSSGNIIASKAERVCVFGFGKRICMGERFGTDLSVLYLANMVRSFRFESIPGHPLSPDNPIMSITLAPRPFQVKWTSRYQ